MPGLLENDAYLPRLIDKRITEGLEDFGAVCIQGPKYCGKTWTGLSLAKSEFSLMNPAGGFQNRETSKLEPDLVLDGEYPRLIDEWQEAPALWDAVRNRVDRTRKQNTFILTGSVTPSKEAPQHSGVGRIERILMRPMTLSESGDSSAKISLRGLFAGERPSVSAPKMNLRTLTSLVIRGGWPGSLNTPAERAYRLPQSYIKNLIESDLSQFDGVNRDADKVARLMHSLARNAEQATATKTLIRDMTADASGGILSAEAVTNYITALRKLFVLEEIPSWSPNLRSPVRINKKPKYHFVDPSLPAAILGATSEMLLGDLETFGFLFESLCIRDLLVYADSMDADIRYYRDKNGLEIDAIITRPDGSWAGIEIKLGHSQADKAAENLLELRRKMTAVGAREPVFLAIVEGLGDFGFVREDGVYVLPICALGV
jgi:predicted AAA+ superfamily ATPase